MLGYRKKKMYTKEGSLSNLSCCPELTQSECQLLYHLALEITV